MAKRPPKPPIQELPEGFGLRAEVSMSHERFIGRIVVAWAKLEGAMDKLIWSIFDQPIEFGRVITTRLEANAKAQMIRSLAPLAFTEPNHTKLLDLITDVDGLREDRNMVTHGVWAATVPHGGHVALSFRPKDAPDVVVGELFLPDRMRSIAAAIESAKNRFPEFHALARKRNEELQPQSRTAPPSRRPNPTDQ